MNRFRRMLDQILAQFLERKYHPFVFALYRIVYGCYLLLYFALLSNRWIEFYGPYGTSPIKLRSEFTMIRPSYFSYLHTPAELWVAYVAILLACVLLILGRMQKWPAFFLWLTMISVENSNGNNVNAEEFVLALFAFYALVLPINSTLNFDFRRWRFSRSSKPVLAWAMIPFFVHIELVYIISLPLKPLLEPAWVDGSLLYWAVNNYDMSRIPTAFGIMKWNHAIISKVGTWLSLIVEGLFPILVWFRRYRVLSILTMVGFQVSIALMLSGVQMFSLSMIVALVLFLPSQETEQLIFNPSWQNLRNWLYP